MEMGRRRRDPKVEGIDVGTHPPPFLRHHRLHLPPPILEPYTHPRRTAGNTDLCGKTTAAYASYRIALSNGWTAPKEFLSFLNPSEGDSTPEPTATASGDERPSLVGFEDLGDALAYDNDYGHETRDATRSIGWL